MQSAQVLDERTAAINLDALEAFIANEDHPKGESENSWSLSMMALAGLTAQRRLDDLLQRSGYSKMPANCIAVLFHLRDAMPNGLTQKLMYRATCVSNLSYDVNRLRTLGFVDLVSDPRVVIDRRSRWLKISAAGLEFLEAIGA